MWRSGPVCSGRTLVRGGNDVMTSVATGKLDHKQTEGV